MSLTDHIRTVPDYPKPGILFYDVQPMLANVPARNAAFRALEGQFASQRIDTVVGIESRGFLFAMPIADRLQTSFAMVRKKGKLPPGDLISQGYGLEYGTDIMEISRGMIKPGSNVALVDDVLATGGTAEATVKLIRAAGGNIRSAHFMIELPHLHGREVLTRLGVASQSILSAASNGELVTTRRPGPSNGMAAATVARPA